MAFQILALSGGGYLGLYTAEILALLERETGRPLASCFDLVCGTSVGGILAIGLAMEVPAADMRDKLERQGERIFSARGRPWSELWDARRFFFKAKYDGEPLRAAIAEMIGAETKIGDAKHRLLVPAVNMTKGSVQMFKTGHHADFKTDPQRNAVDVAMATSAAPTYFPLALCGREQFVDGGIVANAPDVCALHEATHFLGQDSKDVRILSIGTTTTKFSIKRSLGPNLGIREWMSRGRLFSTIISAQQQLVEYILGHDLGDRYFRVDAVQSPEQQADLALDIANKPARETLLGLAEATFQKISTDKRLQSFLSHSPSLPEFFHH